MEVVEPALTAGVPAAVPAAVKYRRVQLVKAPPLMCQ
jgi:hypothetical protein